MSVLLKDLIGILPNAEDTKLRISYVGGGSNPDIISVNSPIISYLADYTVKQIQMHRADRELDVTLEPPEDAETPAASTLIGSIEEAEEKADTDEEPIPEPEPSGKPTDEDIAAMHAAGKSYKEIAAETGLTYGVVWTRCNKAKKG